MKKHFYTLFMIAFIISSMGFRGCGGVVSFLEALFNYTAGGTIQGESPFGAEIYKIAVGENGAIFTSSGRESTNWIESQSGTTQSLNFVRTYYEPDSIVACAVGNSGTVLFSHDKGIHWSDHSIPALSENLNSFDFIYTKDDYLNIVVCGEAGIVYRSSNSNGVYTWQQVITTTTEKLNTIGAIGSDLYIIAGENGKIIKTYDGGLVWDNVGVSDTSADFNRMFLGLLVNAYDRGWIVGDNGKIYMTTNYGNTWLPRESGTSENLYDITFKNELEGVVVGANGVVRYTSDGGFSWHEDTYLSELTTRDIISITGIDPNTASAITRTNNFQDAVGGDTTYIYTVSSEPFVGIEDDEYTTPTEFRLEQNYPNPFNPSTKIRWQLPVGSQLSLKVYDLLGNEIATLVSEEKPAGTYEVEFNSESSIKNLPAGWQGPASGIYFYELKAGSLLEVKKMILMK
jgi:photosystem II stability/assembly factor-like uncharacterized protein